MEENKTNIPEAEEETVCTAETEAAEEVVADTEAAEEKPCKGEKKKLKKAEAEIALEKRQMLLDVKNELSDMAVSIASKVVEREIRKEFPSRKYRLISPIIIGTA